MKPQIRLYTVAGWHWHGVMLRGKLFLIGRIGRVGDCIQP